MSKIKQTVSWSDRIDAWRSDAEKARFIESEIKKAFLAKTKKIWLVKKAEIITGMKAWMSESYILLSETDKFWLAEIKESIYTKEEALWLAKKAWIDEAEKAWLKID
jgi:hypothetical protein